MHHKLLIRALFRLQTTFLAILLFSACSSVIPSAEKLSRYEFTQAEMGLPFRIVLYAPDQLSAETASLAVFERIKQLNDIMSDYEADSELSRLSRTSGGGRAVKVSDDLWRVLFRAQSLARQSGGAFDVTVGPVVNLWRKARREKAMPDPALLSQARAAVGYEFVKLDSKKRTAELTRPGMRLDLGAIAKGYAVDEALKVLRERGINRALVSGCGDMAAGAPPPGKKGWRIALAPLDVPNPPPARYVLLSHHGLATSGDVFQHLEINGRRFSHIVDPRTGVGLTDHSLVTVIARDCMTADGLATTVSVLGPVDGLKLIEKTPETAARITRKPDETIEVVESKQFKDFYDEPQTGR